METPLKNKLLRRKIAIAIAIENKRNDIWTRKIGYYVQEDSATYGCDHRNSSDIDTNADADPDSDSDSDPFIHGC